MTSVTAIEIADQGSSASEVKSSHPDSQELLYLYPSDIGTEKKEQASSPRVVTAPADGPALKSDVEPLSRDFSGASGLRTTGGLQVVLVDPSAMRASLLINFLFSDRPSRERG